MCLEYSARRRTRNQTIRASLWTLPFLPLPLAALIVGHPPMNPAGHTYEKDHLLYLILVAPRR